MSKGILQLCRTVLSRNLEKSDHPNGHTATLIDNLMFWIQAGHCSSGNHVQASDFLDKQNLHSVIKGGDATMFLDFHLRIVHCAVLEALLRFEQTKYAQCNSN